jgi:hypothetical protein
MGEWRLLARILISALNGGEWLVSYFDRFTSRERASPLYELVWMLVDLIAGLDTMAERIILVPTGNRTPVRSQSILLTVRLKFLTDVDEISGSHGDEYEGGCLLGCCTV